MEGRQGATVSWRRAWLIVGLAAWGQVGVLLVDRADRQGVLEDVTFSPNHLVGYAALLVLAAYVVWNLFRAVRRGAWRTAFPQFYGGLGVAFGLLVGWVIVDSIWRSTLGINPGIEGGIAPPRLLIPVALVLMAIGPLREAIAARARPGIDSSELRARWAGVVAAGLVGGALTLVVFNPVRDPFNDWSLNAGADRTEIWTMSADGSDQTRTLVANGDGVDYSLPAWSPDGNRIAYTQWTNRNHAPVNVRNQDQTAAIWSMAADGSDRKVVFDDSMNQAWIPAWSPDGTWIAYTLTPSEAPLAAAHPEPNAAPGQVGPPVSAAGASIWMIHPDGSGPIRLTADGVYAVNLVWAPGLHDVDQTRPNVAFAIDTGGGVTDIRVARFDGVKLTDEHALAANPANDWGPAWSSDGKAIAFVSNRSGNDEIWLATLDGTLTNLTDDSATDWVPVFSPDGTRIAFVSDRTGEPEVWSMAVNGSDLRNLTNHPNHYDGQWSVAWSPSGDRIAFATGAYPDAASSGWVREDLAVAQAIVFGLALAIVALLIVALGAPLGSFTLVLTIIVALSALPSDTWRFLPTAIIAGLLTDGFVRSVRLRLRPRVAAAALPGLATLGIGLTIGIGGTLAWSITLLLGVSIATALFGWGLAEAVERLLPRPHAAHEAPSG